METNSALRKEDNSYSQVLGKKAKEKVL